MGKYESNGRIDMNSLKEKMTAALGTVGIYLWFGISVLITFAPLAFVLKLGIIIDLILIAVVTTVPVIGTIVELGLWIWSFVKALSMPFDLFIGIYYVALAIYVFTKLVPTVMLCFRRAR